MIREMQYGDLYMRNSKKNILIATAVILTCIILYNFFCIVEMPDYAAYTKLMLYDMYTGEDCDIVFLGSSKTYSTICPEIIKENLSMTAFDLASSGQGMMGGYYLLKEYFDYHDTDYVVLEMQESKLLGFSLDGKGMNAGNYQITDALKKTNATYWEYFKEAYVFDNYFSAFFPVVHYRSNFTYNFAKNRIFSGQWLKIINNIPYGEYKSNGYLNEDYCNGEFIDKTIIEYDESVLCLDTELCEESLLYFEKTLELCKENNCKLILMTYPVTDHATSINKIQECNDFYSKFAQKYNVAYLNMMLCIGYCEVKDDAYDFSDAGHMNDSGAKKYSYFVCKELKKVFDEKNYAEDFYSSADEWAMDRKQMIE